LPLAWFVLVTRRDARDRTLVVLSLPLFVFALFNAYLHQRIPGYVGLDAAHGIFWDVSLSWPFASLVENAERWLWAKDYPIFEVTYGSIAFYVVASLVGLRPRERMFRLLPIWILAIVLFHASLSGIVGVWDFARLVLLAWPAALLAVWRLAAPRLPSVVGLLLCGLAGVFSGWFALAQIDATVAMQTTGPVFSDLPHSIERLDDDAPRWLHLGSDPGAEPAAP